MLSGFAHFIVLRVREKSILTYVVRPFGGGELTSAGLVNVALSWCSVGIMTGQQRLCHVQSYKFGLV